MQQANPSDTPTLFKWINRLILLPILLWPFVFFGTIFLFDSPNISLTKTWLQFIAINLYPLYLILLFKLNAKLYKESSHAAYTIPMLVIVCLSFLLYKVLSS